MKSFSEKERREMSNPLANRKRDSSVSEIEASSASFSRKRTKVFGLLGFDVENASSAAGSPKKSISSSSGGYTAAEVGQDNQCLTFCSDCSSNESREIEDERSIVSDLEARRFQSEISTYITNNNDKFSRETSPSSEICGLNEEADSMAAKNFHGKAKFHRIKSPNTAPVAPSPAELDEFFSSAEKCQQRRFAEKYNYDIVKDAPLEGRYKWVRLRP